jgi:hypothetical protein
MLTLQDLAETSERGKKKLMVRLLRGATWRWALSQSVKLLAPGSPLARDYTTAETEFYGIVNTRVVMSLLQRREGQPVHGNMIQHSIIAPLITPLAERASVKCGMIHDRVKERSVRAPDHISTSIHRPAWSICLKIKIK